jgi:hypothetical protein
MTLTLDHIQRLNLVAILETLESAGRREAWAVCKLQDQLELNDEEKSAIGLKKETAPDGRERLVWDVTKPTIYCEYEFQNEDIGRICHALDKVPIVLSRDRWFRTLNAQLPEPVESNGSTTSPTKENTQNA